METDSAVEIRTQLGFPQLLENSLEDSAFSQFPQARRRAKYQPISVAAIHLKTRGLLSEEWGAPQFSIDELKTERSDLPFALLLPCLHEPFLIDFYERIKLVDLRCFRAVAKQLGVENYAGLLTDPNWPLTEGVDPVTLASTSSLSGGRSS